MAFEYDGKIYLNLEEQVEVNSRMAVDAKEAADAATEAVANKMDKVPSAFKGGIPTINMDGSLTNSDRRFTVRYGTAQHGGQTVYTDALIPTEKATVDFLNDNYTKSADITTALEGKVNKTTDANVVYGTKAQGVATTIGYTPANTASTIVSRDSGGQFSCSTPTASSHAATKGYVDTNFAPKAKNGYVEKKTATGTSQYVYGFTGSTQNNLQVSYGAITGASIVSRNGGRIKCGAPDGTDNNHVVTLGYANTNFAPKAENGYVEKQTTSSGSWRAYVYNNAGDNSLLVISGGDGTVAPTATGNIVATTSGRIRTNTPTGPYHATNKQYVDDLISSAVVDFNGSNIDTPTTEVGLKVYAAMQTFGFFVPKHTGDGTIFARPLTDSEVTIPANTFAFSAIKATSSGLTDSYSSGLYYTVDSAGVITAQV